MVAEENGKGALAISFDTFKDMVDELIKLPVFRRLLKTENTEILFQSLDDDNNRELCAHEFLDACDSLLHNISVTHQKSLLIRSYGFKLDWLIRLIDSGALDRMVTALLVAN